METFSQRIAKLSPQRLMLLALQQQQRIAELEQQGHEAIAVVGLACRMPGAANAEEFWDLLQRGSCAVEEVPKYRSELSGRTGGLLEPSARWGAFLAEVDRFDPQFFNISPAEAVAMDPQQRLLLEVCWEALERSSIPAASLVDTKTGVFIGISSNDYALLAQTSGTRAGNRYVVTGASNSIAVGRISYLLGLHGPNMAVDTSCSSSATSVHLAIQSLRRGESDLALAGGVSLALVPSISEMLARFNMLAMDGRCKPFSAAADGFGRGEGCGIVVLKRLKDALREKDNVLGVLLGSACNSDGRSSGLTAPSGLAQEMVIQDALSDAGVPAREIDWIEAHGTGTPLGDPIELTALGRVFSEAGDSHAVLPVSSVKSNINHLEAAAGVAGLIKVLLAIEHQEIPGTLQSQPLNPRFDWQQHRLSVAAKSSPWRRSDRPRRAGVSSFGFSGTNVHLVVEEPPQREPRREGHGSPAAIVTASAKTKVALKELCARYARYLGHGPDTSLDDFAHSVNAGRTHFPNRLAAVVQTTEEARRVYLNFSQAGAEAAANYGFVALNQSPQPTFIFRTEQPLNADSIRLLQRTSDVFRDIFSECEKAVATPTSDLLLSLEEGSLSALRVAEFGVLYSLARLLGACGIAPSSLVSLGVGEIAAAAFAHVMSLGDAATLAHLTASADNEQRSADLQRWISGAKLSTPLIMMNHESGDPISTDLLTDGAYWTTRDWSVLPGKKTFSSRDASYSISLGSMFVNTTEHSQQPMPWAPLLQQLAELYLAGASIDWSAVPSNGRARKLVLPTYPFQRERHWLDLTPPSREEIATTDRGQTPGPVSLERWQSWLYETVWEPLELEITAIDQPPAGSASDIMASMRSTLRAVAAQRDFSFVNQFRKDADALSVQFIARALSELSFPLEQGNSLGLDLCTALGVNRKYERLLQRMFNILRDEKIVALGENATWTVQETVVPLDLAAELKRMRSSYPSGHAEIDLFERGVHLGSILSGRESGLGLLFPNGSMTLAENLYQHSTHAALLNPLVAEVAKRTVSALPADRKLRILEIGAGTGSTSALILRSLSADRVEYVFTDLSMFFLTSAAKKFAQYDFVRYALYDVEGAEPPADAAWATFDLVIAANVLHATKSLRHTLKQVRKLMAPGGFLLLLEAARSHRLADITLGTIEGWWGYEDLDLRQSSVLIQPTLWQSLLQEAGFSSALLPEERDLGCILEEEPIILARFEPDRVATATIHSYPSDRKMLVVGDGSHQTTEVCLLLERAGIKADLVSPASLERPRIATEKLAGVVFFATAEADLESVDRARIAGEAGQAGLALVQSMLAYTVEAPSLWLVCRTSPLGEVETHTASILRGLRRVAETEHPQLQLHLVEYDDDPASRKFLTHLIAAGPSNLPREIRIIKAQTYAPKLQALTLQPQADLRFDPAGAYLITGGLGVLGFLVTRWLAEHGAGTLFLVSRRSPSLETAKQIQELERLGTRIILVAGDVSVEEDVASLFRRIEDHGAPLRGVFHSAGVLEDAPILGLTPQSLQRTFAPKVKGAWLLHQATSGQALDHFVLFSSAAAVLGPGGQASYAMANSFLAALARYRVANGLRAVTIDWGPWTASGLPVQRDFLHSWKKAGGEPIQEVEGLEMLAAILQSRKAHVSVLPIGSGSLSGKLLAFPSPELLQPLLARRVTESEGSALGRTSLKDELEVTPSASRGKVLSRYIERRLIELLDLERTTSIPMEIPFLELGVDSLTSLEMASELQDAMKMSLPSSLLLEYPTRRQLDDFLGLVLQANNLNQAGLTEEMKEADDFDHFII